MHISRDGSLSLGRRKPVLSWDNVLISRNHLQLDLKNDGAVLSLSVHGRNAVVVERQLKGDELIPEQSQSHERFHV